MKRRAAFAKKVMKQWPPVIAEALGLRAREAARPASGKLPERDAWESARFGACWLGQATALLRIGGATIITDPHFGERAGLSIGGRRVGRWRSTELPGRVEDLPPIDAVVLSHAHFDHWDKVSLKMLVEKGEREGHRPVAIIPRGTRRLLPWHGRGFGGVIELDWECEAETEHAGIRAIRPAHWGARWMWDKHRGYNAYVVDGDARRFVFAGDTANTDAFDYLATERQMAALAPVDLAVLGIGNYYEPWHEQHATPEQAADMAKRMGAHWLMPVHHSTFRDPVEPIDEPLERLMRAWAPERVVCGRVGESWFSPGADADERRGTRVRPENSEGE